MFNGVFHSENLLNVEVRKSIAQEAYQHAGTGGSQNWCAQFVRQAVEAVLGVKLKQHHSAKDYGPSYVDVGFVKVATYSSSEDIDEGSSWIFLFC